MELLLLVMLCIFLPLIVSFVGVELFFKAIDALKPVFKHI